MAIDGECAIGTMVLSANDGIVGLVVMVMLDLMVMATLPDLT